MQYVDNFIELYNNELIYPNYEELKPQVFYNAYATIIHTLNNTPLDIQYISTHTRAIELYAILITTPYSIDRIRLSTTFIDSVGIHIVDIMKWFDANIKYIRENKPLFSHILTDSLHDIKKIMKLVIDLKRNPNLKTNKICLCCYNLDRRQRVARKSTRNNGVPHEYSGLPIYVRSYNYTYDFPKYELATDSYCNKCKNI
jgi:hypothetical protein